MAHPHGRKERTRIRILKSAARLFAAQGFKATSIEAVMRECGLTRGGFYAHFRSKSHLYEEAARVMNRGDLGPTHDWLDNLLAACSQGVNTTMWASMSADVASLSPSVRKQYRQALEILLAKLGSLPSLTGQGSDAVLARLAMLVGALSISATIDDARLRDSLVGACRSALEARDEEPSFFWALDRPLIYALNDVLRNGRH